MTRTEPQTRRRRWIAIGAVIAALVLAGLAAFLYVQGRQPTKRVYELDVPVEKDERQRVPAEPLEVYQDIVPPDRRVRRDGEISWREWKEETLKEAERLDKLIVMDLTTSWCHDCSVMKETTYSDPRVISLIRDRYVAVRVDADRRPDLRERYLAGGHPTTAFLYPTGERIDSGTYIPPSRMKRLLGQYDDAFHGKRAPGRENMLRHWKMLKERMGELSKPEPPSNVPLGEALEAVSRNIRDVIDTTYGGFGGGVKYPSQPAVDATLLLYHRTGEEEWREMAVTTLDGQAALLDPVFGGLYEKAKMRKWKDIRYAKLLETNARGLSSYLDAHLVTGEKRYREAAESVLDYVERFLADSAEGGYFLGQHADVGSQDPKAQFIPGVIYYRLDEEERKEIGFPEVDRRMPADANGRMISAVLRASAVLDRPMARAMALRSLDRLLRKQRSASGTLRHTARSPLEARLDDQISVATALIDAYEATGSAQRLADAERLLAAVEVKLHDPETGAFFDLPARAKAYGYLRARRRPFEPNARAAAAFARLAHITGKAAYLRRAKKILAYLIGPSQKFGFLGAPFLLAHERVERPPVHLVIVGDPKRKNAQALLLQAGRLYEPRKVVHVLDPADGDQVLGPEGIRLPTKPLPAAYVCIDKRCSAPIEAAGDLGPRLEKFVRERAS